MSMTIVRAGRRDAMCGIGMWQVARRSFVMAGILLGAAAVTSAQPVQLAPGEPLWTVRLSGVLQENRDEWKSWYTTDPTGWDGESAANGTQGFAIGVDAALEYRVARRVGLGVAVGYVPIALHAEVHRTAQGRFAKPEVRVAFVPLRLEASVDLARPGSWILRAGVLAGTAFLGSVDVIPEFGRSRHFEGGWTSLVGAHMTVAYALAPHRWRVATTLQYLRPGGLDVAELGTGDLAQHVAFAPVALHVSLEYAFGRRAR